MESKCSLFMPWSNRMQMLGCQWLAQEQLRHPNPWKNGLATLVWLQRPEERLPTFPRLREGWWWSPTVPGPVRVCMAWWSPVYCLLLTHSGSLHTFIDGLGMASMVVTHHSCFSEVSLKKHGLVASSTTSGSVICMSFWGFCRHFLLAHRLPLASLVLVGKPVICEHLWYSPL